MGHGTRSPRKFKNQGESAARGQNENVRTRTGLQLTVKSKIRQSRQLCRSRSKWKFHHWNGPVPRDQTEDSTTEVALQRAVKMKMLAPRWDRSARVIRKFSNQCSCATRDRNENFTTKMGPCRAITSKIQQPRSHKFRTNKSKSESSFKGKLSLLAVCENPDIVYYILHAICLHNYAVNLNMSHINFNDSEHIFKIYEWNILLLLLNGLGYNHVIS